NTLVEALPDSQRVVRGWWRLRDNPNGGDLAQRFQHGCGLQIMAAVGKVEGFIDQWKIRHDVAENRMFQHGPVLPGRIMWMTATNHAAGIDLERHEDRTAPALDESDAERVGCGPADLDAMRLAGQPFEYELHELTGLHQFIEPHGNARCHIAFLAHHFTGDEGVVRRPREIDSCIEGLSARAAGKSNEPETSGELRAHLASAHEAVADAGVLVIDALQMERLCRESSHMVGQRPRS